MASFNTLPLRADLIANLTTLEYLEMTPIQAASLPPILACAQRRHEETANVDHHLD